MLRRYHGISIAKSMLVLTLSSKMWICYSCVNGAWLGKAQGQERQPLMVHVSLSPKRHMYDQWPVVTDSFCQHSLLRAFCRNERKVSNILRNHISPSNCTFQVNPDPRVQTDLSSLLHGPCSFCHQLLQLGSESESWSSWRKPTREWKGWSVRPMCPTGWHTISCWKDRDHLVCCMSSPLKRWWINMDNHDKVMSPASQGSFFASMAPVMLQHRTFCQHVFCSKTYWNQNNFFMWGQFPSKLKRYNMIQLISTNISKSTIDNVLQNHL